MIKIENPSLDKISNDYFSSIKDLILERSTYYGKVLDVLFNNANYTTIANGSPHGTTKKSLINLLLLPLHKLNNQDHYDTVIIANCIPSVTLNAVILRDITNYLNVESNLKELILCSPDNAIAIETRIKAALGINGGNLDGLVKSYINNIINYDLFDNYAYDVAKKLNINTCPYCNRNYINTVIDKKNKGLIRPTFDHFFPQSIHPFLALSFYNLIPSCYYCNSSLKSATSISISTHINPYKEGFNLDTTFQILIKGCKPNKSDPDNYSIFFKDNMDPLSLNDRYRKIFGGTRNALNNLEGNINLFKLTDIYQSHRDIVGELVVKCDSLSSSYAESLQKIFRSLGTNKADFYQFYFGNYSNEKEFNRRPMAKLTKDVVNQVLPSFLK